MATRIVYFLADDIPNSTEQAELKELNKSLQVTVMNASENAEFGENDRILPCDFVAGTIPPEYAHIPIYDISGTSGGPIYIDDVVGLPAALDAKADKPVGIEDVTGLQTELDDINTELDAAATLPIAIADVTGLQASLDSKATKPVPITDVSGLQAELDTKAELPIAISDVTGLQAELDAVASLPIAISDVTGLQTSLDSKATLTQLQTVVTALDAKADAPIQIQDVEGLETELDSVATLPIAISDVTGLQDALDSAGSLPIEISDVTGLQAALDAPVPISDVTGLQTALDSKAALTDLDPIIADLATKQDAPVAISDVTGLQAELDSVATLPIEISDVTGLQAELDSVATLPIAISDVTGLQAELDAPTLISEVTGLQTALDGKADVTDLDPIIADLATKADAPVLIADVTGLQTELDGKAELPIAISDVTGLQAELDSSATLPITIADVTGLQTELDGKAELPVTIADVTGLQASLDSKAEVTDLDTILVELDTKLESPIAIADVTGLQANLNSLQTEIDAAATLPIAISDVTGLQTALDAPIAISDVTGLQAELDAPVGISDVTGLQTALDSKADLADLDPIITDLNTKLSSPIAISDVTNLQTSLDGKAPVTHAHSIGDVTGLQTALDSKQATPVPVSDVTGLQASLDSKAAAVHGHAIADVSGLQTTLDGKSETTHVHPVATPSADGFFSKTDKDKLDKIASNATAITFPAANAAGTLANGAPQPANAGAATSEGARSDHQHPLASAANDGLMSAANWTKLDGLGAGGGSGIDTTTRHVYVAYDGSNYDDGLTPDFPKADFAGIDGVWSLLPATLGAPFIVHVTGTVNYVEPPLTTKAIGEDGYICIIGVGEGALGSGTVVSSPNKNELVGTGFAAKDVWTGYTLLFRTGACAGCRRTILYNTTTIIKYALSLTNSAGTQVSPTAGDTFDIVKPLSVIKLPAAPYALTTDIPIHLTNIAIDAVSTGSNTYLRTLGASQSNITLVMIGVEWRCTFYNNQNVEVLSLDWANNFTIYSSKIGRVMVSMGYSEAVSGFYQGWGINALTGDSILLIESAFFCTISAINAAFYTYSDRSHFEGYLRTKIIGTRGGKFIVKMGFLSSEYAGNIYTYNNAYISFTGTILNSNYTNSNSSIVSAADTSIVVLAPWSNAVGDNWTHGNSGAAFDASENASIFFVKGSVFTISSGGGTAYCKAIQASGNACIHISSLKSNGQLAPGAILRDNARVTVDVLLDVSQATTDVTCVSISDNAQLCVASTGALKVINSAATKPTVLVDGGKLISRSATANSCTIGNTYGSGSPVALHVTQGGHVHVQSNPLIYSIQGGTTGFGVSCRGGGRFTCNVWPTNVQGLGADFTIGPTVSDQFADTALQASYSHVTLGMSSAQRSS